jgi:exopolysaccharide production protein ExoQ
MVVERKMARGPGRGEKVLAILILFALTKPFFSRSEGSSNLAIVESGPSGNVLFALVYGTALILLVRQGKVSWRTGRADLLLVGLVAFAILSTLWSIEPYITLRGGVYLVATSLVGVYLAARYSRSEQVELAGGALAIAAVLSLLVGLVLPSYGGGTDWAGVFQHKNTLGRTMALAIIVFALIAVRGTRWRWLAAGGAALAGVLILLSGSGTALVVVACMAMLVPLYAAMSAQVYLAAAVTSAALLLGGTSVVLLLSNPDAALQLLHRDVTLTGRTTLWAVLGALILLRPWLGYGYQAFWWGEAGEVSDVWKLAGWTPEGAHNGFLEIALGLGIAGLVVLSLGFLLSFKKAFRSLSRARGVDGLWPVTFLSYFLLYNLTESSVLQTNNILWVLYVGTVLALRQEPVQRAQARGRAARLGMLAAQREGRPHRAAEHSGPRDGHAWRPTE